MAARKRSLFGWLRSRLSGFGATSSRSRKRPGHVPSVYDSLERRQVLSTATFTPFAAMPVAISPIATTTATVATTTATTTATVPVSMSSVAAVYYSGQPVVGPTAAGISAINLDTDYVQDLYRTVLDRVARPNEVAAWVAEMNAGMSTAEVATGFINSVEHRQDEVDSYYEEFLHRTPDAMADDWVNDLLTGASEEQVVEGILDSPEYQAAHQDNSQFIQGMFEDVLGRPADAAGFAGWEEALGSGESRAAIVASFVQSPEAIDQVLEDFYSDYLHRQPDLASSAQWATVLASPNGSASTVAVGILSSGEFVQDSQQA